MPTPTASPAQIELVELFLTKTSENLALLIDREITLGPTAVEIATARPAGRGAVHISFKLGFEAEDELRHGSLLVPLAEAQTLAGYLMMLSEDAVQDQRQAPAPDQAAKDAMLELGNFIGGAVDEAARDVLAGKVQARSLGCQGVRADVRPAFPYEEGTPLVVGRSNARIQEFPEFELILMFETLPGIA